MSDPRPWQFGDDVEIPGKITGLNSDGEIQVTYASGLFDWHDPTDVRRPDPDRAAP